MENLGIDIKLLVAQLLNFLLFFIIINKFLVKPFLLFLNQEKKQDKDKEEALSKIKKIEESLIDDQTRAKAKINQEYNKIMEQAKKDSQQIKDEMIIQAQKEVEEIRIRMKKQLEAERNALYKDIKEQITTVSLNLVSDGLKEALDDSDKSKITKRILMKLTTKDLITNYNGHLDE